jgi:alpha-1,2-glucosyltransferase
MPFFQNDHWYNKITADILNVPLVFFTKNITLKMIFSIPVILSIFSLSKVELHDRRYLLLYPFTFIFLGLSWLIEQRYYIIPIVLFLIFRKMDLSRGKIRIEYLTLMAYIALAMMLFFGVVSNKFAI